MSDEHNDNYSEFMFSQLLIYLDNLAVKGLLDYVRKDGERFIINEEKHPPVYLLSPDYKYRVACVLMLLGELEAARKLYRIGWEDLGPSGDIVGKKLLKSFVCLGHECCLWDKG